MTSVGEVTLRRIHFACPDCRLNGYVSDPALGLEGYLSKRLCRLACLAAGDHAFARAAVYLQQFCGITVAAETLRLRCEAEGQRMAGWQPTSLAVAETFAKAVGELELQMDAGKANTLTGWRDVKLACFGKRPLGVPAAVTEWDRRELPPAEARTMFAAVEPIEEFQKRLRPQAIQLGLNNPVAVHALGDGADWIWNAIDSNFPKCRQTLDVYHGCEHLGTASKALYGEATPAARTSFARGRALLLAKGWPGVCDYVAEQLAQGDTPQRRAPLEELLKYFAKHTERLDYRGRLAEGRPIGSGLVEGSIKTVGLRLKARGARWRVENVDKMAGLCCLRHSTFWDAYWRSLN
jgi:hypothetical protein